VFRTFRRFLAALDSIKAELRGLSVELSELCATLKGQGPATARLEALELGHLQWEAMCEGLLLKAEGKLRAANNAEARERANKKSYAHLIDPFPEDGADPEARGRDAPSDNDAPPSEEERLQSLRLDVAASPKALAQRAKFGVR